ncbi:hypothetical protein Hanom_Chr17g01585601 [Helianthus anomalus]
MRSPRFRNFTARSDWSRQVNGSRSVSNSQLVKPGQLSGQRLIRDLGDLGVPSSISLSLVNNRIIGRICNIVDY